MSGQSDRQPTAGGRARQTGLRLGEGLPGVSLLRLKYLRHWEPDTAPGGWNAWGLKINITTPPVPILLQHVLPRCSNGCVRARTGWGWGRGAGGMRCRMGVAPETDTCTTGINYTQADHLRFGQSQPPGVPPNCAGPSVMCTHLCDVAGRAIPVCPGKCGAEPPVVTLSQTSENNRRQSDSQVRAIYMINRSLNNRNHW